MTKTNDPFADPVEPQPLERIASALERIAKSLKRIEGRIHDSNDNLTDIRSSVEGLCQVIESRQE